MTEERLTAVVTEYVDNSNDVVQTGPVVGVTLQTLLKGMPRQWNAQQSHSHLTNLVPYVHICGIQHHSLRENIYCIFRSHGLEQMYCVH